MQSISNMFTAHLLSNELLRSLAPELLALVVLTVLTFRLLRVAFRRRRGEALPDAQAGVSALEFTLLLPVLLSLLLMILQVALIVQAKFVVNYAAFCAVRAAIVTIPASARSARSGRVEPHNYVALNDLASPKQRRIQQAAALALTSISPAWSANLARDTGTGPDATALARLGEAAAVITALGGGQDIAPQLLARASYAYDRQNTKVEIIAQGAQRGGHFREHDEITVRVTFRYFLTVPFASRVFGKPYWGSRFAGSPGRYLEITEQYTLLNEGEPLFPARQAPHEAEILVEE
jgi:Flp pilus assembly protein TadG